MKAQTLLALAITALSFSLIGCEVQTNNPGSGSATQDITKAPAQPTTVEADRRDLVGYRLMAGRVYVPANAAAEVVANGTAPVQSVEVKEGEHVSRGEAIVILATGQIDVYQQAKTSYDAALAAYNQAVAQYEQPVRDVERQLQDAKSTERTIRESTAPGGDATELQQATSTRHTLEDQLKVVRAQANTNLVPFKAQLNQAKVALAEARSRVKDSIIEAPVSGTVVSLTVTSGQTISGRAVIARIVDLAALAVKSHVTPDDASFVKRGTKVAIVFGDYPDRKFEGTVRKVDALPAEQDGKVEYEATIDFTNTDGAVKPNSTLKSVGVIVGHRKGVVTVPIDAVGRDSTGKSFVKVMENDDNWKVTVVDIGMTDGNFVEIKSGVQDGDKVQVVPGQGQWLFGDGMTEIK
jgi:RND family efflux transporter MFP subunit